MDWIPAVAARNLIVIGRDKRIRTKPEEIRRLLEAGLRVLRIGPWFYVVNDGGLSEVSWPTPRGKSS